MAAVVFRTCSVESAASASSLWTVLHGDRESFQSGHLVEDGKHRNRVGGGGDGPEHQGNNHWETECPVGSKSGDQGRREHADSCQEQNRQAVFPELPDLELETAFKQQRGKEDEQRDTRRQPIRLVA